MATDSLILLVGEGDPLHAAIEYTLLDYQITLASTPTSRLKESLRATWPHLVVLIGDAAADGGARAFEQLKGPGLRSLPKIVLLGNARDECKPPIAQIISRDLDVTEIAAALHAAMSSEVIDDHAAQDPLPAPEEFGPNAPTAELALGGLTGVVASADPERRKILRQALEEAGVEANDGPLEWSFLLGERTRDPDIVVVDGWNQPEAEELVRRIRGDLRLRWAQIGLLQKSNLRKNPLGKLLEKASEQETRSQADIDRVFQAKGAVLPLTRLGPARWLRKLAQRKEISHATIETARLRIEFETADGRVRSVWAARPGRPATGGPEALAAMLSLGSGVMTAHRVDKDVAAPWDIHCEQAFREAELALQRVRFSTRPPDSRADVVDNGQSSEETSAPHPTPRSAQQAPTADLGQLDIQGASAQSTSPFSDVRRDLQKRQGQSAGHEPFPQSASPSAYGQGAPGKPAPGVQKTIAGMGRNLFADVPEDLPLPDLDDDEIVAKRAAAAAAAAERREREAAAMAAAQTAELRTSPERGRGRIGGGDSQAETRRYPANENAEPDTERQKRKRWVGGGLAALFLLSAIAFLAFRSQQAEEPTVTEVVTRPVDEDSRRRRNIGIMQTVAPREPGVPVPSTSRVTNDAAVPEAVASATTAADAATIGTEAGSVDDAAANPGAAMGEATASNASAEPEESTGDATEARLRAALAEAPDDHHIMVELSELLIATHRGAQAVPLMLRAVERRRTRASYRIILGDAYRDAGDVLHAREAYQAALTIDPSDAIARRKVAELTQ